MQAGLGYLLAAYGIVLVGLSGYALALVRRERALRRELRAPGAARGARDG
jgi:CcmD family protein